MSKVSAEEFGIIFLTIWNFPKASAHFSADDISEHPFSSSVKGLLQY
jgi:hypothetical protein